MVDVPQAEWYTCNASGERDGPFSTNQIIRMRQSGRIGDDTPCWREGMDDWMPLDQAPSLVALIDAKKRPARRRMWITTALLIVAAVGVGAGVFAWKHVRVPEAVARAEKAIAEQQYLAAGESLRPYLKQNAYKNPHALTLMGVASLGFYASGDANDGREASGFRFGMRQQKADSVKFSRDVFERAFERDPSWRNRAAEYVHGIIGAVPEDAPDVCDRCVRIAEVLIDLEIADPSGLARQALEKYRSAVGGIQQADCSQEFAEVVLLGEPKLGTEFVSAIYRFRRETPAGKRLGNPGKEFVSWAEQNPRLTPSLSTGLTGHANTASTAGNYAECDDALTALCQIDDKSVPQTHKLWLESLAGHFESDALADVDGRQELARRLNDLAGKAGVDVQAVADLYLTHRTELISSDPKFESSLRRELRDVIKALGHEYFLRSGERLFAAGNYAAAIAELRRVQSDSPHDPAAAKLLDEAQFQLHLQRGKEFLQAGECPAAESALREALALKPDDETATAGLDECLRMVKQLAIDNGVNEARARCDTGQFDEARSILVELAEKYAGEAAVVAELRRVNLILVESRLKMTRQLVSRGELETAEAELQSILADLPDNTEATQMLDQVQGDLVAEDCEKATSLVASNRLIEARTVIAHALKRRPTDSRAVALDTQIKQYIANPETTELSGIWNMPDGTRILLAQEGDQVSVSAERLARNFITWGGTWTRDGKNLSGTFRVAVQGMSKPASIEVRAEIQDSTTISVRWKDTTWLNAPKTRGRGHGEVNWIRSE